MSKFCYNCYNNWVNISLSINIFDGAIPSFTNPKNYSTHQHFICTAGMRICWFIYSCLSTLLGYLKIDRWRINPNLCLSIRISPVILNSRVSKPLFNKQNNFRSFAGNILGGFGAQKLGFAWTCSIISFSHFVFIFIIVSYSLLFKFNENKS